jgi:hypothetical protein
MHFMKTNNTEPHEECNFISTELTFVLQLTGDEMSVNLHGKQVISGNCPE